MKRKAGRINKLARPLGLEIEVARLNGVDRNFSWSTYGHWERDATLTDGGLELVLQPTCGDQYVKMLGEIIQRFRAARSAVDSSCGFHVHVQAGDLGWFEVRRLIALWCKIEPQVFGTLVRAERRENHYCIPLACEEGERHCSWQFTPRDITRLMRNRRQDANEVNGRIKNRLIAKLYNIDFDKVRGSVDPEQYRKVVRQFDQIKANKRTPGQAEGRGCRYAAMNLHAFFFQKTIEFRLKEGTLDPTELVMWPLFCGWIVESVTKLTDKEILGISGLMDWAMLAKRRGVLQKAVLQWVEERWMGRKQ